MNPIAYFFSFLTITVIIIAFNVQLPPITDALSQEIIARRKAYVASISPTARIIVNNGTHLFFMDDSKQIFGLDDSGKTYSFSGLNSMSVYKDCIKLMHNDSISLCIGRENPDQDITFSLDHVSIIAIKAELLPVLRKNLYVELQKYGVSPTHECEHDGEIWGCDLNSKKFYTACGYFSVYNFSDLRRVTIEDLRDNPLYDGSYIIHVYVKWYEDEEEYEEEYDIHFALKDATFDNLLAMFKGIRNRRNE